MEALINREHHSIVEKLVQQYDASLTQAKQEEWRKGYSTGDCDGHDRGRKDGQAEAEAKAARDWSGTIETIKEEVDEEGYDRGFVVGKEAGQKAGDVIGYDRGHEEGCATATFLHTKASKKIKVEALHRGIHIGMLLAVRRPKEACSMDINDTSFAKHPYWVGRAVAHTITSQGL